MASPKPSAPLGQRTPEPGQSVCQFAIAFRQTLVGNVQTGYSVLHARSVPNRGRCAGAHEVISTGIGAPCVQRDMFNRLPQLNGLARTRPALDRLQAVNVIADGSDAVAKLCQLGARSHLCDVPTSPGCFCIFSASVWI